MAHGSKKAVITAIMANGLVTVLKFVTAMLSGSASMMNEAVHSLMDTLNQGFLYRGLVEGERPADTTYAFGHGQKKYLWNLWSAIGLFSIGSGLGLAHAWHAWHDLDEHHGVHDILILGMHVDPLVLNLSVLGVAFVIEGYSFLVALKEFFQAMREDGASDPVSYLFASDDPTLVAVVLEDSVAMLGLAFAALGVLLAAVTGNPIWDIAFSACIALMLGVIAFYLGYVNMRFLTDIRDREAEQVFAQVVATHAQVERYHDLRSVVIDENNTVVVAEIELKEEAVVPQVHTRALEMTANPDGAFFDSTHVRIVVEKTLERAEEIIDELEAEVQRALPRVTHMTIEVEGIAPFGTAFKSDK